MPGQPCHDSAVYLVLSILEGHGFGFLQSPVVIVASACGISLDTEVVPPCPDPVFHVDLVWETNKKSLRRFRASNTPIKLECFSIDVNKKRDCIGSVLLNIKSAQVVPTDSDLNTVNERWYKLIGVPAEGKALQPELLLSLKIQDTVSLPHPVAHVPQGSYDATKDQHSIPKNLQEYDGDTEIQVPSVHARESTTPFYNNIEQYIQIGPKKLFLNSFLLILNIGDIAGVEMLVVEKNTSSNSKSFQMTFSVMNQNFNTKIFDCANTEQTFGVNEAIVIRLRTTLQALSLYLQENPSVTVHLLWKGEEVAAAELHLRSLVPTENIQSFSDEFGGESTCSQRCMWVSSHSGCIPVQDGFKPYVEVSSKLQLLNVDIPPQKAPTSPTHHVLPESHLQALDLGGELIPSRSESRQSQETFILSSENGPKWVPVVSNKFQTRPVVSHQGSCDEEPKADSQYIRNNVQSASIKLIKLIPKHTLEACHLRIIFECSQKPVLTSDFSDITIESGLNPVFLSGVCARISISSPSSQGEIPSVDVILSEVQADPTITQLFAFGSIHVNLLRLSEKDEYPITIPLRSAKTLQEVCVLHGTLLLEGDSNANICSEGTSTTKNDKKSEGLQYNLPKPSKYSEKRNIKFHAAQNSSAYIEHVADLVNIEKVPGLWHSQSNEHQISSSVHQSPFSSTHPFPALSSVLVNPANVSLPRRPVVYEDTGTAYQIVEELEDWKEKQQELFQAELKRKESDHLSLVSEALTVKKDELESLLGEKIKECKVLLQSLSDARGDLLSRLKKCQQQERELQKEKEELEHQYNSKFQELILTAKRLDDGAKLKVSLAESKCSQMEERLSSLEAENEHLRQRVCQNHSPNPHGDSRTCGMSHNQVTKLLSQVNQLEEKLQSCLQSKAYFKEQWGRAVREMNQSRCHIVQNSEKFGIDNILEKEEAELLQDKRALEKLHKELANNN